jgi:hypothetical protein
MKTLNQVINEMAQRYDDVAGDSPLKPSIRIKAAGNNREIGQISFHKEGKKHIVTSFHHRSGDSYDFPHNGTKEGEAQAVKDAEEAIRDAQSTTSSFRGRYTR